MATKHVETHKANFLKAIQHDFTNEYHWTLRVKNLGKIDDTIGPIILIYFKDEKLTQAGNGVLSPAACVNINISVRSHVIYKRSLQEYLSSPLVYGRYRKPFSEIESVLHYEPASSYIGNPALDISEADVFNIDIVSPWRIDTGRSSITLEILELRGHVGPKEISVVHDASGKNNSQTYSISHGNAITILHAQTLSLLQFVNILEENQFYKSNCDYKSELQDYHNILADISHSISPEELRRMSARVANISEQMKELFDIKRLSCIDDIDPRTVFKINPSDDTLSNGLDHQKRIMDLKTIIDWIADLHASGAYPDADPQLISELQSHYISLSDDLHNSIELDMVIRRVDDIFRLIKVKKYKITVNAQETITVLNELTYDQIMRMAYAKPPSDPNIIFTITYQGGKGKGQGELTSGQTVKIKEGMVFNIAVTSN